MLSNSRKIGFQKHFGTRSHSLSVNASISEFKQFLASQGIRRAYIVFADGQFRLSHKGLEPFVTYLKDPNNGCWKDHEAMFFEVGKTSGCLMGAFLHSTIRGQAHGGVRYWPYASMESFIHDGLRLSLGMGRKNALAGLWWGGGKGILVREEHDEEGNPRAVTPHERENNFQDFGRFLTGLRGAYYGAEDVGCNVHDVQNMGLQTRFVSCLPQEIGGSGNPSKATALGVVRAMEAALAHLNMGDLKGKSIAMQGAGNVAAFIIEILLQKEAGKIIATDISESRLNLLKAQLNSDPRLEFILSPPGDNSIYSQKVDIFSPCALGGILNEATIPMIQAPIVCGAANNQLLYPKDGERLHEAGITYVPDFVANRMGIVNCANEMYGYVNNDPYFQNHLGTDWEQSVYNTVINMLALSKSTGLTPDKAACEMADQLSQVPHPIWGHRSKLIIDGLLADDWANKGLE